MGGSCSTEAAHNDENTGSGGQCRRTNDKYHIYHTSCDTWSNFNSQRACDQAGQGPMTSLGTGNCRWYGGDCASTGKKGLCIRSYPLTDTAKYKCCNTPANQTSADTCGQNF